MDLFTYTPGGVESIDAFNQRLAAYAASNNVIGVVTSQLGTTLLLSLALADDLPQVPPPPLLRPFVAVIDPTGLNTLETSLTDLLTAIKAEDDEDKGVMSVPVECKAYSAPHGGFQAGYAVFLIVIGALEEGD